MPRIIVTPGDKYHKMVIEKEVQPIVSSGGDSYRAFLCKCDCGTTKIVKLASLRRGETKSCGCLVRLHGHGMSHHQLYGTWGNLLGRCRNPSDDSYHNYGGRGISVCQQWQDSFKAFYDWAIASGWKSGLQIDREDNDGPYCPENCRFVTSRENNMNRRSNRMIEFNGETMCLAEWAERLSINYACLYYRLFRLGWSVERALTVPQIKHAKRMERNPVNRNRTLTYLGIAMQLVGWAEITGLSIDCIRVRIRDGREVEEILVTPEGENNTPPTPTWWMQFRQFI